jgi:hypothetical protein
MKSIFASECIIHIREVPDSILGYPDFVFQEHAAVVPANRQRPLPL